MECFRQKEISVEINLASKEPLKNKMLQQQASPTADLKVRIRKDNKCKYYTNHLQSYFGKKRECIRLAWTTTVAAS